MTQAEKVLERLRRGPLTALEAQRELGIMRLAARIDELRVQHKIETTMVKVKNREGQVCRVASYWLREAEAQSPTGVCEWQA